MLKTFFNILFPIKCIGCDQWDQWLCQSCINKNITPASKTMNDQIKTLHYLGKYQNTFLQSAIHDYKYNSISEIGILLGNEINKNIQNHLYDYIIPVPLHKKRLKERGFNQSEIIAKQCNITYSSILKRQRYTTAQATLNKQQRLNNLSQAFTVNADKKIYKNKRLLLIDDVYTTGTTITTCASLLKQFHP